MTSPLVARLIREIDQCADREGRAILLAELACYWARTGEFEEAERLRKELRADFGDGRSIRVSILIMCLEANLLYYKELSPNARDRMARASLLSKASGDRRLITLTSAWMAHIDFNLNRFDVMVEELDSCFQAMDGDDGTAECRASLVLGDSFLYVGNTGASRFWYERARRAAVRIGDQAAVGAMTYNRAALLAASARLGVLTGAASLDDISRARAEVESAINYQAVARLLSLDHLLQTARVGVLMLHARYADALASIEVLLTSSDIPRGSPQLISIEADRILCIAKTNDLQVAAELIAKVPEDSIMKFPADDRAVIFSSLNQAALGCGNIEISEKFTKCVKDALEEHSILVNELRPRLSGYEKLTT